LTALLRAVVLGLVAGLLGAGSWAWLLDANIRHGADVPWAVPVMVILLGLWWLYFARGRGWPAATSEARRRSGRANPVPSDLWGPALGAGVLGLIAVLLLQGVLARLVSLPQQQELDPSKFPVATVVAWVVMSAIVAGVVEETAFRGYLQGGIERHYGPVIAILVTGSLFGFAHFRHPEVGVVLLPYYIAVTAVYGGVAYAMNSTFPSMVLHSGGNVFSAVGLFTLGRSEWQLGIEEPVLVWQSGVDAPFVISLLAFVVVSAGTVVAFRGLVAAGREARLHAG
jgi:membrane protease YdiL (CAAX protease family)